MTGACHLCGELITHQEVPIEISGEGLIVDPGMREALEYQALVNGFMMHMLQRHPDYVQALQQTAMTYQIHLIAKLLISTHPAFEDQREQARRLCYWTLAGKFAIEEKPIPKQAVSDASSIQKRPF